MKLLSVLLVAALFVTASCSQNETPADTNAQTENRVADPALNANAPATGTSDFQTVDPNLQAQPMQPAQTTQQPVGSGETVALNPEHGLPGHRCDIPVGAPLNSPPGQQPQSIQIQ